MPYVIAAVLVVVFVVNVVLGATAGARIVGNVPEMLILFAAAIAFSVGILRSEARAKAEKSKTD